MKYLRPIFLFILLIALSVLSYFTYTINQQKREIKEDLVELSNIQYGLFNVDEWKKILTDILSKKIEEFEVEGNNKQQLKTKITGFLYKVIGDFEDRYYEKNSGSIGGFFKNIGAATFNIFGEMKQNIPHFTDEILNFLNDPRNKKALKSYLSDKLNNYADSTFAQMDYSLHDAIIAKYQLPDRAATLNVLNLKTQELQQSADTQKYLLVLLALVTAAFMLVSNTLRKTELLLLTALCFLFLILGLTLPMIEIDARIAEISIRLLGENIRFTDQVLYYKSKSIFEVVRLMMLQGSFDLLLVGSLIFLFSVLFPFSKLLASVLMVSKPQLQGNKIIYFLVHKTGKWSMADVMVVAIFMSYIGFSGILTEQLQQLEHLSTKIELLSTNHSSLQIGFFAFTSFALLSLLMSAKMRKQM